MPRFQPLPLRIQTPDARSHANQVLSTFLIEVRSAQSAQALETVIARAQAEHDALVVDSSDLTLRGQVQAAKGIANTRLRELELHA